jgi:hypothetical protein
VKRDLYLGTRGFGLEPRRLVDDAHARRSLRRALDEALPGGAIFWEGEERPSDAPAAAPAPRAAEPAAAARENAPATFPDDIDGPAIARAKREAARFGVPFCEECTRRRLAHDREEAHGGSSMGGAA